MAVVHCNHRYKNYEETDAATLVDTEYQQFLKKLTRCFNRNLQACKHEGKHACIDNFFIQSVVLVGFLWPKAKETKNKRKIGIKYATRRKKKLSKQCNS